ncbi:hypothetical protein Smp_138980 [Schistosoma mansoni]|uniref:hypothetical protein n=1 Tax=Schistosoma mansoni TaxID=6183 RepID=UPI0001A64634|nr:hypothetical protein Smp_138980 [Schistosoma mansoni]|eukprot:XP_018653895.1 hypothetical protein Smp_138980 [Schistosoma mansoni]
MYECRRNKHLSFDKNSKQNLLNSSLPIQLDHVDQYYYELMKLCSTSKNYDKNSKTSDFYCQKPLTNTFMSSNSNYSAEFQNSHLLCCLCCSEHSIGNPDKSVVHYLNSCCNSQKLQRIIHHLILVLLGISIVLSIILSLLGIFLNYRTCLTAGCILGIASFGALLHSCLRHRALPNSSMPIILGQSYMHPVVNNIPLSMNKLYRKHQQFAQRHRQLLNYDYSRNNLTKHSYFTPTDGFYTNDQDYNNSKNNHGKNIPIKSKRNLDKLCYTTYQTTTDVECNHSGNHMDYTHSNNLVDESKNYVPRSSSPCSSIKATNVQQPQFRYFDSRDLSLSSEIKAESQDQIKRVKPFQKNTFTHIQPNSLNSCNIEVDKQFHPYYSVNSSVDGKSNLFIHNTHINEQPKHLNSFMIYPKSKSRNKIILRNYLNLLDGLYRHVNHSQRPNYSNDRFNEEYNSDIFGPRVWLSWKNWSNNGCGFMNGFSTVNMKDDNDLYMKYSGIMWLSDVRS